jgi:cell fate (sporulation/competence/biofilm development) regulator YmcA (YheA/YmcA/DUF963 family)
MFEVADKESIVVKEIKATKKQPCTLHQDKKKDALRVSQIWSVPIIADSRV